MRQQFVFGLVASFVLSACTAPVNTPSPVVPNNPSDPNPSLQWREDRVETPAPADVQVPDASASPTMVQNGNLVGANGSTITLNQLSGQIPTSIPQAQATQYLQPLSNIASYPAMGAYNYGAYGYGAYAGCAPGYTGYGAYGNYLYYPYQGYYIPYYLYGGCYYPYAYNYAGAYVYPLYYGYMGSYYPYYFYADSCVGSYYGSFSRRGNDWDCDRDDIRSTGNWHRGSDNHENGRMSGRNSSWDRVMTKEGNRQWRQKRSR